MKAKVVSILWVLGIGFALTGCYWNKEVAANEVGVQLEGGKIASVVGPGLYSGGYRASMTIVDISVKRVQWSKDQELITSDLQPIGLTLDITYRRDPSAGAMTTMYTYYREAATNDQALADMVMARVAEQAKTVTAQLELEEMLGTSGSTCETCRQEFKDRIVALLAPELAKMNVILEDVYVSNINPNDEYVNLLNQRALAELNEDVARQQTILLAEQLKQEQAQTNIALEIANREAAIAQAGATVYDASPAALRVELAKVYATALNEHDKIIFVPAGTDITAVLAGMSEELVTTQVGGKDE